MESDNKQLRIYDVAGNFYRVSVDEAIANGFNKWEGWTCSAGVKNLYIDNEGKVFSCNTVGAKVITALWREPWDEYLLDEKNKMRKFNLSREELEVIKTEWRKIMFNEKYTERVRHLGYIGRIGLDLTLPVKWMKCPCEACACGADVIVSKADNTSLDLLAVTERGYRGQEETRPNEVNHLGRLHNQVAIEMDFPIPYQILWDFTNRCNYNCSYCWPDTHNKTEEFLPTEYVIDACNKFIDDWAYGEEIRFNFGGGEPTIHPGFLDILRNLKERDQWVLVTSNGSRSPKFWEEAVQYIKSVNLSAHFEFIDKKRFIENLTIIFDRHDMVDDDHWIEVKLMAPPGRVEEAIEFKKEIEALDRIDKLGANGRTKGVCSLVPIRSLEDSGKLVDYSEDEICHFQNQ